MDQLNKTDRELLESVLLKKPSELLESDIDVLNARRSYIPFAQRRIYVELGIMIDDGDTAEVSSQAHETTQWNEKAAGEEETKEPEVSQENAPAGEEGQQASEKENPYEPDPNQLT